MWRSDVSLPAGVHVNDDVTGCAVVVNVQEEADIQLEETGKVFTYLIPVYIYLLQDDQSFPPHF